MSTDTKAAKVPGKGAQSAATPIPTTPTTASNEHLPNAVDLDLSKLTGPTLTRQGWLVPPPPVKA